MLKTPVTGYGRGLYGAMQRRCSRCLGTPCGLAGLSLIFSKVYL